MGKVKQIEQILEKLRKEHPVGFAIGLHVAYTAPRFMFQTYSKEWMEEYSRQGFIMRDPTVKWGLGNDGWMRWSGLADVDEGGVLGAAAAHGLPFGVAISVTDQGSKSIAGFASDEAEFTDDEAQTLVDTVSLLHGLTMEGALDPEEENHLRKLAVSTTHS